VQVLKINVLKTVYIVQLLTCLYITVYKNISNMVGSRYTQHIYFVLLYCMYEYYKIATNTHAHAHARTHTHTHAHTHAHTNTHTSSSI